MEKTLQAQYNLIKEGKGDKAYFLKSAFRQFPDMLSQINSFSDTVTILKNRGIISESIGGLVTTGKKQDWHAIFNENMNKLKENADDFFVVEKPNGYAVKYFSSYDEALAYVNQVDPEGMIDLNIRQVEDSQDTELARRGDEYTQGMEDLHALPNKGNLREAKEKRKLSLKQIDKEDKKGLSLYKNTEDPNDLYYYDGKVLYSVVDGDRKGPSVRMSLFDITGLNEVNLTEAKEIKEPSKEVLDNQKHNFDYKDTKNYDNVFGQEFLKGYYTEMKDPKNADKDVEELREIVAKNLAKDINYYVKDGQFGVKGLGYTTEAPGLGTPKEAKGKYKSSGYGDLKESVLRSQIHLLLKEILEEAKEKPSAGLTKKEKSAISKKAHAGKDIGKKGKGFEKVAKAAEKQYGSKEAGEKVAAAAMWKSQAKKK